MKERPILFSADMVRAILDGRKTMTRRVIKPQPPDDCVWDEESGLFAVPESALGLIRHCPYKVGMNLWVRETWCNAPDCFGISHYVYKATAHPNAGFTWKPSIFMPRWASRITLEITGVRVDKLQNISDEDCDAEMFGGDFPNKVMPYYGFHGGLSLQDCFAIYWDSINAKRGYGWTTNPWVWVITFERTNGVSIERE